jgi:hypothetical protein
MLRSTVGGRIQTVSSPWLKQDMRMLLAIAVAAAGISGLPRTQFAGPVAQPVASFRRRRTLPGERDGHNPRSVGTLLQPTTRAEQWLTGPATSAFT